MKSFHIFPKRANTTNPPKTASIISKASLRALLWIDAKYVIILAMTKRKTKTKAAASRKSKKKKQVKTSEITGIILILMALFILLSLISYDSQDPSWASTASQSKKVNNYAGKAGAALAEVLLQILGFASFLIPFCLFYLGFQTFMPGSDKQYILKSGSIIFLLLVVSALLNMLFQEVRWREAEISSGGLTGYILSTFLIKYFNHTGTILLLAGFIVLFFIFSTHLSISKIYHMLSGLLRFIFKEVRIRITRYQKTKRREKMKQKVIEKYTAPKSKKDEKKQVRKEKKKKEKAKIWPQPPTQKTSQASPEEKLLFPEMEKKGDYAFPPFNLLDPGKESEQIDKNELYEKKQVIEEKLQEFRIEGEVKEYHPGPIITTYEYYPHPGIKVSQIASCSEDLSLALGAESVRIQRIPGKSSLGVEVPNNKREIIKVRDIIQTEKFMKSPSKLTLALGKTIHGEPFVTDLSVMPHLLIAGATGTGKSVALNSIIASILYKARPEEVKLILIDPKRLEFSIYDGIPHLMCPVVKDPRKAEAILLDAIKKMEERYHKLGILRVRNIEQYNQQVIRLLKEQKGKLAEEEKQKLKPLPYLVIIIDELAELMMIGAQEVEYCIARLAQLARAVGIHLVMATQRPSIDVITGTIKNNFSSRIAFRVPSKVDSRIIIDTAGAEKLLGKGDMLFMPPNYPRLLRLHCSYISLPEITRLVKFAKDQAKPTYDTKIIHVLKSPTAHIMEELGDKDALFEKATELVLLTGQASASYLQRKLKLGYARAARIIDQMEQEGIVGPSEGSKPREILVRPEEYLRKQKGEE
jgi:S-DNA-T family DNA segregation ATPase FtsK/SpoIIIE